MYLKMVPFEEPGDMGSCGMALSDSPDAEESTQSSYKLPPEQYGGGSYKLARGYYYVDMEVIGTLCLTD